MKNIIYILSIGILLLTCNSKNPKLYKLSKYYKIDNVIDNNYQNHYWEGSDSLYNCKLIVDSIIGYKVYMAKLFINDENTALTY